MRICSIGERCSTVDFRNWSSNWQYSDFRELSGAKWTLIRGLLIILLLAFLATYLLHSRAQVREARDAELELSRMITPHRGYMGWNIHGGEIDPDALVGHKLLARPLTPGASPKASRVDECSLRSISCALIILSVIDEGTGFDMKDARKKVGLDIGSMQ